MSKAVFFFFKYRTTLLVDRHKDCFDLYIYIYIYILYCIYTVILFILFYLFYLYVYVYIYIYISGGPLSALTCCVNVRLLSGDKKNIAVNLFSKLGWELGLFYASYDDFHPDILARMYT